MKKVIVAEGLGRTFLRRVRAPGLWGSFKALFGSRFEEIHAVQGLSFSANAGEMVGLIGENGAGKSTTVKMLTGILVPTAGRVRVLGLEPAKNRGKLSLRMGVVFGQRPQLLWDIPVRETFELLRTMYAIPGSIYRWTYGEAVRRLDLEPLLRVPVRQLSLGQRMRCDLAASLLHAPAVAFLDEPTIGLDAIAKEEVREYIRLIQRQFGTTIVLTTHDLKDITELCSRLVVLHQGELMYDGSLSGFERKYAPERRIIATLEDRMTAAKSRVLASTIRRSGGELRTWEPYRLVIEYREKGVATRIMRGLLRTANPSDFVMERADIETIVRRLYRKPASASPEIPGGIGGHPR